jgi:hypothetical protein
VAALGSLHVNLCTGSVVRKEGDDSAAAEGEDGTLESQSASKKASDVEVEVVTEEPNMLPE